MDIITRAKCYACHKPFTVSAKDDHLEPSFNRAVRIMACPYCGTLCQVVISADQAPVGGIMRGDGERKLTDLPEDAFKNHIFESFPVENTDEDAS